jgi:hypothetical protein
MKVTLKENTIEYKSYRYTSGFNSFEKNIWSYNNNSHLNGGEFKKMHPLEYYKLNEISQNLIKENFNDIITSLHQIKKNKRRIFY